MHAYYKHCCLAVLVAALIAGCADSTYEPSAQTDVQQQEILERLDRIEKHNTQKHIDHIETTLERIETAVEILERHKRA